MLKTVVVSLLLLGAGTSPTWAHGGHDDDKFQGAENITPRAEQITVAPGHLEKFKLHSSGQPQE
jgi:hypothetical protein